jgi:hypothetical protein
MAASGNVTIQGNVSGGAGGSESFGPWTTTMNNAVYEILTVTLSASANTITVPSTATVGIIQPPNAGIPQPNPAFSGTLTLKGVTGDTGVVISTTGATKLDWAGTTQGSAPSPPATFVITSTTTGTLWVWFA